MHDFGYIEAQIEKDDITIFQKITEKLCQKEDFYYDVLNEINGNVSKDLHLTLSYGFTNPKDINKEKLNNLVNSIKLQTIRLGTIKLLQGYKNKYQILVIEVLDQHKEIEKIYNKFLSLNAQKPNQFRFLPHLTLAYVKPKFRLDKVSNYPKKVRIKKVKSYLSQA